jgi:hypothetical protein
MVAHCQRCLCQATDSASALPSAQSQCDPVEYLAMQHFSCNNSYNHAGRICQLQSDVPIYNVSKLSYLLYLVVNIAASNLYNFYMLT